ncbi:MAG TPA: PilZ domain-containing protein [Anaeromyxobacteraceae bacterium]|nr:PilZ domain-containing protein [Anaeromyxobacteraceae bacterium]
MSLAEWLSTFRDMHERARRGQLNPREQAVYRAGRDELARALLAAQRLTVKPGETPRQALRVSRALQVDLDLPTAHVKAVSIDISTGGFSTLLSKAPSLGEEVRFALRLPASEPLSGQCRVTDVKAQTGNVRVSFRFVGQTDEDRERLEVFVFDTVLAQLVG